MGVVFLVNKFSPNQSIPLFLSSSLLRLNANESSPISMEIHVRVIPKGWKIYRMNGLRVFPKRDRTERERRLFVFGVIPPPLLLFLQRKRVKIDFFFASSSSVFLLLLKFFNCQQQPTKKKRNENGCGGQQNPPGVRLRRM